MHEQERYALRHLSGPLLPVDGPDLLRHSAFHNHGHGHHSHTPSHHDVEQTHKSLVVQINEQIFVDERAQ